MGLNKQAYFSDSVTSNNTFAAGTLDLSMEPTELVDLDNLKPGDTVTCDFELKNEGSLDIKNVSLDTDYNVVDTEGDNTDDFGKHIQVEFLYNTDQLNEVIYEATLYELKEMSPDAVKEKLFDELLDEDGLKSGDTDDLVVKFRFVDNGEDQNQFQGDELNLEWTFNAQQSDGK